MSFQSVNPAIPDAIAELLLLSIQDVLAAQSQAETHRLRSADFLNMQKTEKNKQRKHENSGQGRALGRWMSYFGKVGTIFVIKSLSHNPLFDPSWSYLAGR